MGQNRRSTTAKSETRVTTPQQIVKDVRRSAGKHHSIEETIRVVLEGLRGDYSIAELCRREGIAENLYYGWSRRYLAAGKKRLAGIRPGRQPAARSRTFAVRCEA